MKKSKKSGFNRLWGKIQFNVGIEKWGELRKHLRGWTYHHHGVYKAQKKNLQKVVNNLDTQAEIKNLSHGERDQLETARDDLIKLLREEELRFYQ